MNTAFKIDYNSGDEDLTKYSEVRGGHGNVDDDLRNPHRKRQVKLEPKIKTNFGLDDENIDIFSKKFKDQIQNINETLDLIDEAYQKNRKCFDNMGVNEKNVFINFGQEIHDLEQYLTASTRFLPDYKVKTCQQLLFDLSNRYKEIRLRVIPKKKFEFNSKKKKEVTTIKQENDGKDMIDHAKLIKDKILNDKRIITCRTTESSLEIKDCRDKYILELGKRVNKHDVTISDLENCFVEIRGQPGSIRFNNLNNCVILCGPTAFSIYGENCQQSIFAIACHQFRLHRSSFCTILLHVTSRAILEDCSKIEIGPYNYVYDGLEQDFKDSGLCMSTNNYSDVGDFDWLSPDAPSPNWKLTNKKPEWNELRQQFVAKIEKEGTP